MKAGSKIGVRQWNPQVSKDTKFEQVNSIATIYSANILEATSSDDKGCPLLLLMSSQTR